MDKDLAELALNTCAEMGAKFVDVRLEQSSSEGILLKNGIPQASSFGTTHGIGIRVLINQTQGFACTNELNKARVIAAAKAAINDAKAASKIKNSVQLAKSKAHTANYEVKQKIKIEETSFEDKLAPLQDIEKALKACKANVPFRFLSYSDSVDEKYYINSEGSKIFSKIPRINFYYFTTIVEGQKSAQRYWQYGKASGFEGMQSFELDKKLSEEAEQLKKNLLKAKSAPTGKIDVVVGPQITGIIVHESGGHPYEADRILGREAAQAGESFISQKSIGTQLGSEAVTITDDPTVPNSFGFYLYDDEGIKASKKDLLKNGKISGFLNSRESAASMDMQANASSRARSYDRESIPRMSNTRIEPGDHSEQELIEGIKKGVYIKSFTEWNIDDKRVNQKYVGAEAYLIHNGRIGEPVKEPTIEISTHALYKAIDACANNVEYHAGSCGKGEPMQAMPVWFGGPSLRIRGIKLK